VSQHLKELKSAGIIHGSIQGPKTCYCLSPSALGLLKASVAQLQTPSDSCC
jgi:ArsR family transcriptional regulator